MITRSFVLAVVILASTMLGVSGPQPGQQAVRKASVAPAAATQVTTTPTEDWRSFKWVDPQVLTFKARDGVEVYARLFTPDMVGAKRDPACGSSPRRDSHDA